MTPPHETHPPQLHSPAGITGARLGRIVLGYLAMTVMVITLSPFRFSSSPVNSLSFAWDNRDVVMNVIMFVPIGFIYQLSTRRGAREGWVRALIIGALVSAAVEAAQFFSPGRVPSVTDLATNSAGACIGALFATGAFGATDAVKAVRAFSIELPLMGVVYLLVPLTWLVALGGEGGMRTWNIVPLALSAGWIIGAVFSSFERASLRRILFVTIVWSVVALTPAALALWRVAAIAAVIALAATWVRAMAPTLFTHEARTGASRRFEAATLRFVLPILCIYLAMSSVKAAALTAPEWAGMLALLRVSDTPTNGAILRAIEHITAFMLLGYVIAEYAGRVRDEFRTVFPIVLACAAAGSAGLEIVRGWDPAYGASAAMFLLTLAGAGFGCWLYVLQLEHVRALVGRSATRDAATQRIG